MHNLLDKMTMIERPDIEQIVNKFDDLRTYSSKDAQAIMDDFYNFPQDGGCYKSDNGRQHDYLVFRDRQSHYWTIEQNSRDWLYFFGGEWTTGSQPEGRLEGPEEFCVYLPESQDIDEFESLPEIEQPDLSATSTKNALVTIVRDTCNDYHTGLITSLAADILLKQYMLVDKRFALWTLGCQSGLWYHFDGEQWQSSSQPPADALIVQHTDTEQSKEKVSQAILMLYKSDAPFLPEQLTQPWTPPEHPPEIKQAEILCKACGEKLLSNNKFCTACGVPVVSEEEKDKQLLRCVNCHSELKSTDKFCTQCGQAVNSL